ncbi:hypothetical protein [Bdellovibrio bacteriovorus]|uniref:hypothetical protein n=1 Tax=Bdellovibrio TaxID=958 RepID=UPI0035A8BBAD
MFSLVPKILLSFLTVSSLAMAEEHGAAPAATEPAKEIKTTEESFAVVQARVQGLEAKVRAGETEIQKLILEKQHTKDPEKVNEIIKQMITLHKELAGTLREYDQQRALLKYRYPEKGQVEKREYERIELKSIEDMETQMSLSSSVKRTLKKVRSQYGDGNKNADSEDGAHDAVKKKQAQEPAPSLVDPVILKK